MTHPASSNGMDACFAQVESVLREESSEAALERAAEACATLSGAAVSALFLFDENDAQGEAWFPSRDDVEAPRRAALRRAARALNGGTSEADAGALGGLPLHTFPLTLSGRTLGALCLLHPPEALARSADWPTTIERALLVLAPRFAAHLEVTRAAATRSQFERWFKTLDEQVRVLDRERQKFAAIVHQSDAHVFVADLEGRVRWTNAVLAAEPPREQGRTSWVGMDCRAVCARFGSQDGAGCDTCPVRGALERQQVVHQELHRADAQGVRNHYLTALPIKGPDGAPHEVMVMIQDLSDLDVLRRSESRYRVLFERSAKAIVMVDPASRHVLMTNPMAERLTGRSAESLAQARLEDLHAPAEWERIRPRYAAGFAERSLAALDCRVLGANGQERLATVSGTRVDLDAQDVVMLEFQDMTEVRRVEEALRTAEERLHAVVANAPLVVFAVDREGRFTLSVGRGLETLGLKPGDVVGRPVSELYAEVPQILRNIQRALAGEEFSDTVQLGRLAFETHHAPFRDADGNVVGMTGVSVDISERHRLEEQLRQSHKMEAIGRLAGGVAHDFNNLLAAILGHSELLASRLDGAHPLRASVEEIQKAGQRGALLTRQLLAFSRKQGMTSQVLDLGAVVVEMEEMLRRLIGENIELVTRVGPGAALARMDRGHLEQIVMNLVVNGRDALPDGGEMSIEVESVEVDAAMARGMNGMRAGPYVALAVRDNGCGMDAATMERVFEPFFTTKHPDRGTGLGLSTVFAIVEQSGGNIAVTSQPGLGTTIRVYLPRAEGDRAGTPPAPLRPGGVRGAETVLLVEDEDAVRAMARDLLCANGYTVIEASHGAEAIQRMREAGNRVDLLLTDVVMPQMGGGELAQRLRLVQPDLRVLFMSGYPDDAIARQGPLLGDSEFIEKPFALEALLARVRQTLDADPPTRPDALAA